MSPACSNYVKHYSAINKFEFEITIVCKYYNNSTLHIKYNDLKFLVAVNPNTIFSLK